MASWDFLACTLTPRKGHDFQFNSPKKNFNGYFMYLTIVFQRFECFRLYLVF